MCHDGDLSLSDSANLIHKFKHLIGILIRQKALGPKGQGPGSDAKILDVRKEAGIFEGLKIPAKNSRLHDHGIPASEENITDLLVIVEVGEEAFSITLRKFQVRVPNELSPTKAIGAVCVARLPRGGEK